MSFCAITPTRGDRPKFLEHLAWQISRMTVKPEHWYIIDHKPKTNGFDLIPRIKEGIRMAYEDGFNEVFVLEDDDFYSADYFKTMQLGDSDFVGCETSIYYNLSNRTWQPMIHPKRSSLFQTGFKISALKNFKWPADDYVFLDLELWKQAKNVKFVATKAIGIKHGIGLCGGKGHKFNMKNKDFDLQWLKSNVDSESFEFYKSIL